MDLPNPHQSTSRPQASYIPSFIALVCAKLYDLISKILLYRVFSTCQFAHHPLLRFSDSGCTQPVRYHLGEPLANQAAHEETMSGEEHLLN